MKTLYHLPLTFITVLVFQALNAQDITGDWYGKFRTRDSLHATLHIYKDYNGLKATIDGPDQGDFGTLIDEISLKEDTLFFRIKIFDIYFKGLVNNDYSTIRGDLNQFGNKRGLDFGRKKLKRIIPVNDNTLTIKPAKVRVVKTGNPQKIPYTGIRVVEAGIPKVIEIDTSELKVLIPGTGNVLNPMVYKFPESVTNDEYPVKAYYPQFAPIIIRAKQSGPFPAQPMHMKDAASYNIQCLDIEQGLMDPDIASILEDTKGNMWFGSVGRGVCRYDGKTFTNYTETEGLTLTGNNLMIEDRNGNIWIGTDWGLYKYDGKYFTMYPGEIFNWFLSMLESKNGNIWFGTQNGVFEKKGNLWIHYTEEQGLINNIVKSIAEDRYGNVWFGTEKGVCKYDGVSFTHFTEKEGLISNIVASIIEDKNGNLWFGTIRGVSKYDGKSFRQYTVYEGLSNNDVTSIKEDSNGYLWFGTFGGGVNMFDGKSFTHFTSKEGLSSNNISSIIEDKSRNIWLTTIGSGVMKLRKNSFTNFTQLEDLATGKVHSIIEDHSGNLWFGIFGLGLVRFDGVSFMLIKGNEGLRDIFIRSMLEDKDGNIWFTDHNLGLQKYNENSFTIYDDNESGPNCITCLHEDKNGNIWLGTADEGIKKFDGESFTWFPGISGTGAIITPVSQYSNENIWSNTIVKSILSDHSGNIWYSIIPWGLFKYDSECITQYNINEGLSDVNVSSLFEDRSGNLWIGTLNQGVNRYDGQSFTYITEKEGLSNNTVSSVIGDKKGNIWIGTKKGLSMLTPQEDGNYSITVFGTENGLKNISFNDNSVYLDNQNHLWWGTGNIVTMLDLNVFEILPESPVIQLNYININDKQIDFGALLSGTNKNVHSVSDLINRTRIRGLKFSDVAPFYNYPVALILPHYLNHLTFNFSAIDWTAPQSIRYQYMLEGMDEQWSPLSKENRADYRNIPAGKYTFKVKAIGTVNIWSEIFEYPFTVSPPWWFRWWAWIFYVGVLVFLIRYYIRYRVARERTKAEIQTRQFEVRKMQELDQMKSDFFANISHEFRTPLTLLTGPINDLLINRPGLKEGDRKQLLGIMKRNAGRLQQLINQLLDLSRLETGNLKLQVSEGDMTGLIRTIVLSFLSLAESKKINYIYDLQEISGLCFYDEDKVEKITTNLISNALKFTHDGGSVMVKLCYTGEKNMTSGLHAEIIVKDSGPGIPDDEKEKIFDRFYQVSRSDSREHEGSGIGLALTRELVQLYRGEIHVDSEIGKGSTFTVILPVSREQFREGEMVTVSEESSETQFFDDHEIRVQGIAESDVQQETVKEKDKEKPIILIVEDNTDLRKYISGNLSGQYRILEAKNGKEGLDKAIESIPDLVISDLMMPEMDGVEMCDRLKKDTRTNHIPLIMLTAKADRESKLESLETGADDYIIKPFDAEELEVRVRNLIELRKILREKFSKQFLGQETGPELESFRDHFIKKIINTIDRHYSDFDFSVDELGKELHMSRAQFFRKVNALTGTTPNELLRLYRIKKAASLIESGQNNITAIMYEVGFQSTSHFAKSFRKYYGKNPSEYRDSFNGRN